ncbi:helix-turn-helix transcriptional regulator [Bacillus altitudinis]|uniref:helix-turn-helix transcriptional regulator n=1 Tax=Bacillus altitudinis TaxID=293387 RepID=UPI00064C9938|nr:helix-turn-helix transcriptional regulator [Bacillus altitudinis]KLV15501.1 XRE family transcriptional regulator [Bacillus altitudinis]
MNVQPREWLKKKRTEKNMTQEDVALKAGIARTTYASIEQGERNAGVKTAKSISKVLEFDWTLFFEDSLHVTRNKGKQHTA